MGMRGRNNKMTKLYNEVKDLNMDEAKRILANVSYIDLQREYKELADFFKKTDFVVETVVESLKAETPIASSLPNQTFPTRDGEIASLRPDSGEASSIVECVDTLPERDYKICITEGCENKIIRPSRAKKCDECKDVK